MTHDEFIGQVQNRARLASGGEAETAIRATLETLAQRLDTDVADKLAAQLPPELATHLRGDWQFERFSPRDFFQRVRDREGGAVDVAEAAYHTRVVLEVLGEAVTPGALDKVRATLPDEFAPLFEAGSRGQLDLEAGAGKQQTNRKPS